MFRKTHKNLDLSEKLFEEIGVCIQRFIYHIVKNNHDAEDLLSDTFVKIIEYIQVHEKIPDKALCYAMARNLSFDFLRKKKKVLLNMTIDMSNDIVDESDTFEIVHNKMSTENSYRIIQSLPEPYANVFNLKFNDQMTFDEIGQIMNITENNARQIYYRAKLKLKKQLINESEVINE